MATTTGEFTKHTAPLVWDRTYKSTHQILIALPSGRYASVSLGDGGMLDVSMLESEPDAPFFCDVFADWSDPDSKEYLAP